MISTPSRALRPFAAFAAAVALAATAVLALAAPASAHDQLVSTDPADGSSVAAMPAQVTLTFNAEVLAGSGNEVVVTDAAGTSLTDGPPTVDGVNLVQPLTGEGSGAITVRWRALSSDGHPVSGQFGFTAPAATVPVETTTPAATPEPTMTTQAQPTPSATDAAPAADSSASPLPWIIGAVVVLVIIALVLVLLVRPRRPGTGPGAGSAPGAGR